MPVGFQNQSTVWFLGGDRITFTGYKNGYETRLGGTFDGQGQAWYDYVQGQGNYPHRPMGLTIWCAKITRTLSHITDEGLLPQESQQLCIQKFALCAIADVDDG
jgi:hypothetical protein